MKFSQEDLERIMEELKDYPEPNVHMEIIEE